jgi:phosphoglycolate phosphatase
MSKGHIRNILWDWNGTLLNDMMLCIDCMNILLENRSMSRLAPDHYREIFTFPIRDYLAGIGFDFSKEAFEIPADEFVVLYNNRYPEAGLFSEVRPTLLQLRQQGYKQFILSAQEQTLLNRLIEHYRIGDFFEAVTGTADNYAHSKVEVGKLMMKDLDLKKSETIMIGDTMHDHEVAASLGIPCILVSHGHQSPARLRSTGAPVIERLSEIFGLLGNNIQYLPER